MGLRAQRSKAEKGNEWAEEPGVRCLNMGMGVGAVGDEWKWAFPPFDLMFNSHHEPSP